MKGIEDGTYGDSNYTGNTGDTGNTGNTGEVEQGPDTSDPGAYVGGQPDDTVYDPATGEDQTDPSLSDRGLSIPIDKVYGPDTEEGDHKDFSGLGYGISG